MYFFTDLPLHSGHILPSSAEHDQIYKDSSDLLRNSSDLRLPLPLLLLILILLLLISAAHFKSRQQLLCRSHIRRRVGSN
jgi:hypothetical protein